MFAQAIMFELMWWARAYFEYVAEFALFLIAMRWGGAPERYLSAILLGAIPLDMLYHWVMQSSGVVWHRINVGHLGLDVLLLLLLGGIALRANRFYPLWLGGAQIIAVLSHCYRFVIVDIDPTAYAIMQRMPSWIQLVAMAIGLFAHIRRVRRIGQYPPWALQTAPSSRPTGGRALA